MEVEPPHKQSTPEDKPPRSVEPSEIRIVKLIGGGRALGHADGKTWMIRGALPGELVLAEPTRRRAGIVEAVCTELLADPHPVRLSSPCPHSGSCGGCDWPHADPEAGAELKRMVAAEAAARFPEISAKLAAAGITPSPAAYRLRTRLHWDPERGLLGFFGHRSRTVEEIRDCRIITRRLAQALPSLSEALKRRCPRPVDVETLEGTNELIAAIRPVRRSPKKIPDGWIPDRRDCPDLDGMHILTPSTLLLRRWGRDRVRMDLPYPLEVPLGSFFQGNLHLVPQLFDTVAGFIGPGEEPVFDLHGGVGFLAAAARHAGRRRIVVVEPNKGAAVAAHRNIPDATVAASTAEAFVRKHDLPQRSVVITDPPRSGLSETLRDRLVHHRPRRLIMLGCDPATWSRDAARLLDGGAVITHLELVDLFPFTHHVEVLAALEWS